MNYYHFKKIECGFEEAFQKARDNINKIGFEIITELDFHEKLKKKLNKDINKYKILGVCNPSYAYEALSYDERIGIMMPCTVVIREINNNTTEILTMNPKMMLFENKNQDFGDFIKKLDDKMHQFLSLFD